MKSPWDYSRWDSPWSVPRRSEADSALRVSDAERNEVAEALSRHYADGRLDASEFNERVGRAMAAKTHADLSGLLSDLPRSEPEPVPPAPIRHRSRLLALVILGLLVVAAVSVSPAPHVPWLLIALFAVWAWRRGHIHQARHRHPTPQGWR